MSEARHRQQQEAWSEVRNFIVLVSFMLGIVLFVLFSRPFLFDRVVPAVFGDFLNELPRQVIEKPIINQAPAGRPVDIEVGAEAVPGDDVTGARDESGPTDAGAAVEPEAVNDEGTETEPATSSSSTLLEYTVRTGDSLSEIAQEHDITVRALMQANGLTNPNLIRVGSVLRIPGDSQ